MSELRNDFEQLAKEIDSMIRDAQKAYPYLDREHAEHLARIMTGLMIMYPTMEQQEIEKRATEAVQGAADAGEAWAIFMTKSMLDAAFRPAYDKARKAGVDPVAILRADCGLPESEARRVVAELDKEATA